MKSRPLPLLFLLAWAALAPALSSATPPASRLTLASDLLETGDFARSALEYRRLAADLEPGDSQLPDLYLAAADAYRREESWERLGKMLDKAEDDGAGGSAPLLFLRIQQAEGTRDWFSAGDYAVELAEAAKDDERLVRYARRTAAADFLRANAVDDAKTALEGDPDRAAAIDHYLAGHDKSPTLGGFLGIVPGLGYAYSGEYGNALRSLFLNGLFGWAMFATAEDDQWALFSVATFFELTWYTGSIYGGIDAAHRHNRERLDSAVREIRGDDAPHIGHRLALPLLKVDLAF